MNATKPTLLIIELDYHAEILTHLCPVLALKFKLIVWTTAKIWSKTKLLEACVEQCFIMPKGLSLKHFMQHNQNDFMSFDYVYFNTLEKNYRFFVRCPKHCPWILRIHNVNASLKPQESILWEWQYLLKNTRFLLQKVLLGRLWDQQKKLYQKVDRLMLPSSAIANVQTPILAKPLAAKVAHYTLPFGALSAQAIYPKNHQPLILAVTGTVDPTRKNYCLLRQALQQLQLNHPNTAITLMFLGRVKGEQATAIIQQFKAMENEFFKVQFQMGYMPEAQFTEHMQQAHVLLAPINLNTRHKIFNEIYGITKMSGIENDLLRFQRPCILPAEYNLDPALQPVTDTYQEAEDLCQAIEKYLNAQYWQSKVNLFNQLTQYQASVIAQDFYDFCLTLNESK